MKHLKLRTVFIFGLAALLGALLLHSSQAVHNAENRLQQLQVSIEEERESIRVLEAEWQYLNNPERLEALAEQYLNVIPPSPEQMTLDVEDLPDSTPIQHEEDYKLMLNREAQDVSFDPAQAQKKSQPQPQNSVVYETQEKQSFGGLLEKLTQPQDAENQSGESR
jgi:cell division protein FtsL